MPPESIDKIAPIAVTVADAQRISGIGRTTLYALAKEGRLPLRKVGRRSLFLVDDLRRVIEAEAA